MYDSILFDLDGTLWDATHITEQVWRIVLKRHPEIRREISSDVIQGYMGKTVEELASVLFPDTPYTEAYALIQESCDVENMLLRQNGGKLYPGIPAVLTVLAATYPLFIVSNCQAGYIEAFLSYHSLAPLFRDSISSGDTGKKKADNIAFLRKKYGLSSSLYIGDTAWDEEAAHASGCDFCYAAWGFGKALHPDFSVCTPSALVPLLTGEELH